jgi:hypothetical protein
VFQHEGLDLVVKEADLFLFLLQDDVPSTFFGLFVRCVFGSGETDCERNGPVHRPVALGILLPGA